MRRTSYVFVALCILSGLCFYPLVRICYAPIVVGYGLSANPSSLTINLGESGQSIINVSAKGHLVPLPVDLSASSISGVSTNLNPTQVIIPPDNDWRYNQSTLTITVTQSATPGVYVLTVYADFGLITQNVNITLTISANGADLTPVGGYLTDFNSPETTASDALCAVAAVTFLCMFATSIIIKNRKSLRSKE